MNILRWSQGPVKFISPEDMSTTVVVCEACGWQQDMRKVFPTLYETAAIARGHIAQHNGVPSGGPG